MKCKNEGCPNDAVCSVVWVTQEKIFYCEDCFGKANVIMVAMGSPTLLPLPLTDEEMRYRINKKIIEIKGRGRHR